MIRSIDCPFRTTCPTCFFEESRISTNYSRASVVIGWTQGNLGFRSPVISPSIYLSAGALFDFWRTTSHLVCDVAASCYLPTSPLLLLDLTTAATFLRVRTPGITSMAGTVPSLTVLYGKAAASPALHQPNHIASHPQPDTPRSDSRMPAIFELFAMPTS